MHVLERFYRLQLYSYDLLGRDLVVDDVVEGSDGRGVGDDYKLIKILFDNRFHLKGKGDREGIVDGKGRYHCTSVGVEEQKLVFVLLFSDQIVVAVVWEVIDFEEVERFQLAENTVVMEDHVSPTGIAVAAVVVEEVEDNLLVVVEDDFFHLDNLDLGVFRR